jgi:uncharacterized protein YbjT (DUF2867 family)
MRILINTPTSHIGRVVADRLLETDHDIHLIARNVGKVAAFAARGATLHQGTLEDEAFVVEACQGADLLFWITPPNPATDDMRAFQQRLGEIAATAVRSHDIRRVVNLSSIGAQHSEGAGPISGLHPVENLLNQTGASLTHLRPSFFMENYLFSIPTVAASGNVFMPLPGDLCFPMIATRDIAAKAVARILDATWTGRAVIELIGPALLRCDEAAGILAAALGKPVTHVFAPDAQARAAMTGMGMSEGVADLMLEMYGAMRAGRIAPVGKPEVTATTFAQFAKEVYLPLFLKSAQREDRSR